VLERADTADANGAACAGRSAGHHRHPGNRGVESLQHAGAGLPLRRLDVDAGHGSRYVAASLLGVGGHDYLLEVGDLRHGNVDGVASPYRGLNGTLADEGKW